MTANISPDAPSGDNRRHMQAGEPALADSALRPSVARIIRLLDKSAAKTGYHNYQIFDKALRVWTVLSTDPQKVDMNYWLNEVCVGIEHGLGPLEEAYYELLESALFWYEDVIGSVYMDLWISNKRTGQFFTPMPLARAMADMTLAGIQPRYPGDAPYTICDPCCGSGIMFLAAMEYFETHWPHMLDENLIEVYGQDIDATCVAMAQLNYRMHRAGRMMRREREVGKSTPLLLESQTSFAPAPIPLRPESIVGGVSIRVTDTLREDERAIVEVAIGGPLPVQERLPLEPESEVPSDAPQQLWVPAKVSEPSRQPARKKNGETHQYSQPFLFITDLPLPGESGKEENLSGFTGLGL